MSTVAPPPSLEVHFRRMTPDDVDQVAAIDAETWPWPWPWTADDWRKQMEAPGFVFTVSTLEGRTVGHMVHGVFDEFIHLYKIAVVPEHQRRGIASAMLGHLRKALEASGRSHIQLHARRDDQRVKQLYRRHGFRVVDVEPDYYGPNQDAVAMVCRRKP